MLRRDIRFPSESDVAKYLPHKPWPKQREFLDLDCLEALYGGAAGGGKSDALLAAALQYIHVPGYSAIIFRRTMTDLNLPDAIMDRSHQWLRGTDARWVDKKKQWEFPSGATLTFAYLESENDKYRYQGSAYQFVAFDELTQFTQTQYTYLFSRLRRLSGSDVPIRMRAGSNPGGIGHDWVYERFMLQKCDGRVFIPATLEDNPSIDAEAYEIALSELDEITRDQLRHGNWEVRPQGPVFRRSDFTVVDELPELARWYRGWDTATSIKEAADFTAGAQVGVDTDGTLYIRDLIRFKKEYPDARGEIVGAAQQDGSDTSLGVEDKHTGLALVQDMMRLEAMRPYSITAVPCKGDKKQRALGWAARARAGKLKLLRGPWNTQFINECLAFDGKGETHDDQVDAVSVAWHLLIHQKGGPIEKEETINPNTLRYFDELNRANGIEPYDPSEDED